MIYESPIFSRQIYWRQQLRLSVLSCSSVMAKEWSHCKNILCIRADNMGDLLMSTPALRALKESFGAKITVLTSSMAASIAGYIGEIDEVIVYDLPWVKTNAEPDTSSLLELVTT